MQGPGSNPDVQGLPIEGPKPQEQKPLTAGQKFQQLLARVAERMKLKKTAQKVEEAQESGSSGMTVLAGEQEECKQLSARELAQKVANGLDKNIPAEDTDLTAEQRKQKEIARLASALHILLVSFPVGKKRSEAIASFPNIDGKSMYALKARMAQFDENVSQEERSRIVHDELGGLLENAIALVSGPERAAFFLEYPGVTNDENLQKVHPVPEEWFQASMDANTFGPQMGVNIATQLCNVILLQMQQGRNWEDLAYAYLNRDLLQRESALVARLHTAFRKNPKMPVEYDHPNILDRIDYPEFQSLWRGEMTTVFLPALIVAQWADESLPGILPEGRALDSQGYPVDISGGILTMDPKNTRRLNALFADPRFAPYVDTLVRFSRATRRFLDSERGRDLLKLQRLMQRSTTERTPLEINPEGINPPDEIRNGIHAELEAELIALHQDYPDLHFPSNLTDMSDVFTFAESLRLQSVTS